MLAVSTPNETKNCALIYCQHLSRSTRFTHFYNAEKQSPLIFMNFAGLWIERPKLFPNNCRFWSSGEFRGFPAEEKCSSFFKQQMTPARAAALQRNCWNWKSTMEWNFEKINRWLQKSASIEPRTNVGKEMSKMNLHLLYPYVLILLHNEHAVLVMKHWMF